MPVSDIAALDIDGDGENEIASILPFHGNEYTIWKKTPQGYQAVYTYPVPEDFFHTVVGAELGGEKVFIGGARKLAMQLFVVHYDARTQSYAAQLLDENVGPSNAAVLNLPGRDLLLSANRQIGQAALYTVQK